MNATVLSIKTKKAQGGKAILVTIYLETDNQKSEYTITEGTYREIGCPLSGTLIDENAVALIAKKDEQRRARISALRILSYSDKSEAALRSRLRRAGVRAEAAEEAAKEMVALGYVNDKKQVASLIKRYASALIGKRKIKAKLIERGYSRRDIDDAFDELCARGEIDFKKNARLLVEKKLTAPYDKEQIKKLLYKNGY